MYVLSVARPKRANVFDAVFIPFNIHYHAAAIHLSVSPFSTVFGNEYARRIVSNLYAEHAIRLQYLIYYDIRGARAGGLGYTIHNE